MSLESVILRPAANQCAAGGITHSRFIASQNHAKHGDSGFLWRIACLQGFFKFLFVFSFYIKSQGQQVKTFTSHFPLNWGSGSNVGAIKMIWTSNKPFCTHIGGRAENPTAQHYDVFVRLEMMLLCRTPCSSVRMDVPQWLLQWELHQ